MRCQNCKSRSGHVTEMDTFKLVLCNKCEDKLMVRMHRAYPFGWVGYEDIKDQFEDDEETCKEIDTLTEPEIRELADGVASVYWDDENGFSEMVKNCYTSFARFKEAENLRKMPRKELALNLHPKFKENLKIIEERLKSRN